MYTVDFLDIPALQSASGIVHLPGSKSISNRVLLLAALSFGQTTQIYGLLKSEDTQAMLDALRQLGCNISEDANVTRVQALQIDKLPSQACLHLGNAGTAMRPLVAALALLQGQGEYSLELTGVARMQERPIGDLVDTLRTLGAEIDYLGQSGYPPLRIRSLRSGQLGARQRVQVRGDVSSQFLTALLMALPLLAGQQSYSVEVVGTLISRPYIAITLQLMQRFGVQVENQDWQKFVISADSRYVSPQTLQVEADASSASYFIALGGLAADPTKGQAIQIQGVGIDSIQGDIGFVDVARQMGVEIHEKSNALIVQRGCWPLRAVDMDVNDIPDAAMTLAVMALYAQGTSTLRGIGSWRVKETDRISAMQNELQKLGAVVDSGADWIRITPPLAAQWRAASIKTYDDHRMAMCLSLASFNPDRVPVRIQDPSCVAKTFPDYFEIFFSVAQARWQDVPIICIDGPSASGKGALSTAVAKKLGFKVLDSGLLYRLAAYAAMQQEMVLDVKNETDLAALVETLQVQFEGDCVLLQGRDVTEALRSEECGHNASFISALPKVRMALLDWQKRCAQVPGLVADGRDMGTVVFPSAKLKIFLDASVEKRANRRYKQLISHGQSARIDILHKDLQARDMRDKHRVISPLRPAEDAFLLDNSELSIAQATDQVLAWWAQRCPF